MRTKRIFLVGASVALSALVLVQVAGVIGTRAGAAAGELSKDRLQLVWPSIMNMPVDDRALLVGLAMTCHVEQRPAIAGDVVECLRDAVDDPHAILPKGVSPGSAKARLDQLLRQRDA
jgi:hypothetical protein